MLPPMAPDLVRRAAAGAALAVAASGLLAAPASAAGWARVNAVGVRTVVVRWSPAGVADTVLGRAVTRVESRRLTTAGWRKLDAAPGRSGRLVVRGVEPGLPVLLRVRACGGARCSAWLPLRTRARPIPQGRAEPGTALGPLPLLGMADQLWAHTTPFQDDAAALGLGVVRVIVRWKDVQRVDGPVRFRSLTARRNLRAYAHAIQSGRQVLVTVDGPTPDFALDPEEPGRAPRIDAWRRYARAVVAQFPLATWWEAWNEPNSPREAAVYPLRQLRLSAALRRIVQERTEHGKVLISLGTGKRNPYSPARQIAYWGDYVRFSTAYGIPRPAFDAISFHPYNRTYDVGVLPQNAPSSGLYESGDVGRILAAIDAAFPYRRIPLAITEFGYMTGPSPRIGAALSPDAQADAVCGSLNELRRWNTTGRILMAIWYLDADEASVDNAWTSGLRTADWTPKPGFAAWQRYIADPPATFSPTCGPPVAPVAGAPADGHGA